MASADWLSAFGLNLLPYSVLDVVEIDLVEGFEVWRLSSEQDEMLPIRMRHHLVALEFAWQLPALSDLLPCDTWKLHLLGGPRDIV